MRILLLLVLALTSVELHAQQPRTYLVIVRKVINGSTFRGSYKDEKGAIHGGIFRLLGVDSPIKDEAKGIEQPYWKESKAHLSKIDKWTVNATSTFVDGKEYWTITLPIGTDVNHEMILSGHAWYQPSRGVVPQYEAAQRQAEAAKKGLWGLPGTSVEPWKYEQHLKAQAVSALLDPLGGAERLKKLQRARITFSVTATAIRADGQQAIGKINSTVLLDLPGRIAAVSESEDKVRVVLSLIEGDERFFGLQESEFAPECFASMRIALDRVQAALFSPKHEHLELRPSVLGKNFYAVEFPLFGKNGAVDPKDSEFSPVGLTGGPWRDMWLFMNWVITLHVAESGEILACDCEIKIPENLPWGQWLRAMIDHDNDQNLRRSESFILFKLCNKPMRFFWNHKSAQEYANRPGWSESVALGEVFVLEAEVLTTDPLTEKDEALFSSPEENVEDPEPEFDDSTQTVWTGSAQGRDGLTAWMHVRSRGQTLQLRAGDQFDIGTLKGKVVEVKRQHMTLEIDGRRFNLKPGGNLKEAALASEVD